MSVVGIAAVAVGCGALCAISFIAGAVLSALRGWFAQDHRERVEFIRQASIGFANMTECTKEGDRVPMWTEEACWDNSINLWNAKRSGC